ncbi:MAG: PilZ domain-containing protein [Desulfobacterales bacterium]|nr:PilZ domain-containing protein [Desulfobacterales bacterium]
MKESVKGKRHGYVLTKTALQVKDTMKTTWEARINARFDHAATILIENFPKGTYHHGKMVNYSAGGLYFECTVAYAAGVPIIFGIENSPYARCPGVYHGHVRWCHRLPEKQSLYDFGIGVAYVKPDLSQNLRRQSHPPSPARPRPDAESQDASQKPGKPESVGERRVSPDDHGGTLRPIEQRRHPRRSFGRATLYASRNRFIKGTVKDISKGGMFIEAVDEIAVGEQLNLALPAVQRHRDLTVRGEIVRVDPNGLAIRFERLIKN